MVAYMTGQTFNSNKTGIIGAEKIVKQLLKAYPKYHLKLFSQILQEIVLYYELPGALRAKTVLELGPGTKMNLLRFFARESGAQSLTGVGRIPEWLWFPGRQEMKNYLKNSYILPFLNKQKSKSVDLIYSRHVMEKHSIHPLLLLKHPAYRKALKEKRLANPGKDFPSSAANIQAIYKETFRLLKPGGLLVAQIGKKKNSVLTDDFIKTLHLSKINVRSIGYLSQIVTMQK